MFLSKNYCITFTAYCLLFTAYSFSQENRNSGFSKPVNLPFNLAGSFGEPRKDHFHSGIDIKTNGAEGEPVFAIGDGYISRIRVSPYGYGKAIYITHTNGYTSVYGHLSKFHGAIEKYIHAQHYLQKKPELDLILDATIFPIKQNDTIAFSGNTGGSTAPHLHFEIRNTKTEHALNPLDFYPRSFYVDTIPPQINKVKIYSIYDKNYNSFSFVYNLKKEGNYLINSDTIFFSNDSIISFSLEGFDKPDTSSSRNGIKKIEVYQNKKLLFKFDINDIDFDKTRMCNAFVDYHEMINNNGYFYNCYQLPNNKLSYYFNGDGYFTLNKGLNIFNIITHDYNNNTTNVNLTIEKDNPGTIFDSVLADYSNITSKEIMPLKSDSIISKDFKIKLAPNTFYENVYLNIESIEQKPTTKYDVNAFSIYIPLQKPAKIEFKSSIKKNRNKIVVVRQNQKGKETALKTTYDKTKFYADTKELGAFYLKYDTTKPIVEILDSKFEILNETKFIQTKIRDDLSGINTYSGYIDNKWINFYYDAKNDLIQYILDENCPKGEHLLKIIVTDNVGNQTTVQQKFIY